MTQDEIRTLEDEIKKLPLSAEIRFYEKKDDGFSRRLRRFAETLCQVSGGKITLKDGDGGDTLPGRPALTLSTRRGSNLHYLSIPEGHELPPFIEALRLLSRGDPSLTNGAREALTRISRPADLRVLISGSCPNCPKVVGELVRLSVSSPQVSASIVDVEHFSQTAEQYAVKSVPATIIDEELVLIGQVSAERLSKLLAARGTDDFDGEIIRSLMERGRASQAAGYISRGRGRKAILNLFQEPELSTRMGALMVLEEALALDSKAIHEMVPSLIELLIHQDSRIRGDIADFLGTVGDPRAVPHLKALVNDPDPDVREAASDALERLEAV